MLCVYLVVLCVRLQLHPQPVHLLLGEAPVQHHRWMSKQTVLVSPCGELPASHQPLQPLSLIRRRTCLRSAAPLHRSGSFLPHGGRHCIGNPCSFRACPRQRKQTLLTKALHGNVHLIRPWKSEFFIPVQHQSSKPNSLH